MFVAILASKLLIATNLLVDCAFGIGTPNIDTQLDNNVVVGDQVRDLLFAGGCHGLALVAQQHFRHGTMRFG